jgi:hypothetical protein
VHRNSSQDYTSMSLILFLLTAAAFARLLTTRVYRHIDSKLPHPDRARQLIVLLLHALRCHCRVKGKTHLVNCHDGHRPVGVSCKWEHGHTTKRVELKGRNPHVSFTPCFIPRFHNLQWDDKAKVEDDVWTAVAVVPRDSGRGLEHVARSYNNPRLRSRSCALISAP